MLTLYYLMKKSKSKSKLNAFNYYKNVQRNKNKLLKSKEGIITKCRVCLQEGCMPIFGSEDTESIVEALAAVANITVTENEGHPTYLCDICHEFIKGAILFRKVARESEEILKQPVKEESLDEQTYDQDNQEFSDSSLPYDTKQPEKWDNEEVNQVKPEKIKTKIKYAPKVTCSVCNKVINRSYYKEHMTMHDPDHKKYVCDVCGKSFRLRCAYHNHSLRHGNEFPYKCQFCPYRGRYSELLKTHMRTHTGDYRYMCTECPARFLFKSNLNSHALKHKEPQLQCEACKRAFHTKLLLQRHYEADHLGIKNHVCNICGKAFGYRNAMMKHQRHVHKREKLLFGRMPAYLEAQNRSEEGD
ncbi:zinc finger protein 583 [Helicoverpa armigera]|uniref:zinc finger protein 583 n=1 Tax=Helicoverpa armigera TaxID=29058 RepID=UPI003082B037